MKILFYLKNIVHVNSLSLKKAYSRLTWNGQKKGLKVIYEMLNSDDDRIKWSKVLIK